MLAFCQDVLPPLIASHGYWVVACVIALESMALPVPGETVLIAAAIYAGTTHQLDIAGVIVAAATGAIVGDSLGFWIGRTVGFGLARRYGRYIRLTESKIKLGQYLFLRHGGKVVFFGRFVSFLRALAAFLNLMPWRRFLLFNVAGGWPIAHGLGAYMLGRQVHLLLGPMGLAAAALTVIAFVFGAGFMRRHHVRLEAEAERAFPGPLGRQRRAAFN